MPECKFEISLELSFNFEKGTQAKKIGMKYISSKENDQPIEVPDEIDPVDELLQQKRVKL